MRVARHFHAKKAIQIPTSAKSAWLEEHRPWPSASAKKFSARRSATECVATATLSGRKSL